jgi:hypothetical protein
MRYRVMSFLCFVLTTAPGAQADTTLEYWLNETGAKQGKLHTVHIKDGRILVKGVDGEGKDFLFSSSPEQLFVIDHGRRSFRGLDEAQINRLAKQSEAVQPLLQGFGEQLARLNPKQRQKWEGILGGKTVDNIAAAAKPVEPVSIVKAGAGRKVEGIPCQPMNVFQGKSQTAEFCLADPAKLNISADDYATLRGLLGFSERLVGKTQGLARQFGVSLPNIGLNGLEGVPIEISEVSGAKQSLRLKRTLAQAVPPEWMQVPEGYRGEPFKLWK